MNKIVITLGEPAGIGPDLCVLLAEKYLTKNNPPKLLVEFFNEQKNINNINCFSDEGGVWEKSNISFNQNTLSLIFREKFSFRRGRVNCSLNDNGIWRWFGIQFSVNQN